MKTNHMPSDPAGSNPGAALQTPKVVLPSLLQSSRRKYNFFSETLSYGHTTVKAPYPIRTAQLSTVGPDQYYGRGLRGNLRCCKAFLFLQTFCQVKKVGFPRTRSCKQVQHLKPAVSGVLAQSEACVLSKHEVLGSKPRYSSPIWCSW